MKEVGSCVRKHVHILGHWLVVFKQESMLGRRNFSVSKIA
jgi:hypothetical protein